MDNQVSYEQFFQESSIALVIEDLTELHKAIKKLDLSEAEFKSYLEADTRNIRNLVKLIKIVDINKSAKELLQLQDAVTHSIYTDILLTEFSINSYIHELLALNREEKEFSGITEIFLKNGSSKNMEIHWKLLSKHKPYSQVLVSFHDISHLLEVENKYYYLFDNIPVSIWEEDFSILRDKLNELQIFSVSDFERQIYKDPGLIRQLFTLIRVVDINKYSVKLHGASSKDEIIRSYNELFNDEVQVSFELQLKYLLSGRTEFSLRSKIKNFQGEVLDVIIQYFVPPESKTSWNRIIFSIVDITEDKEKQMIIQEAQNRLAFIIKKTPLVVWSVNREGIFTLVEGIQEESRFSQFNHLKVGSNIRQWMGELNSTLDFLDDAIRGKSGMYTLESENIVFEIYTTIIYDEFETINGLMGIGMDITQQKIAEKQLYQSQKMDAIGRLAGGINHDMANILMSVNGYIDLILESDDVDKIKEDVREIQSAVKRATFLTGQLSTFTRKSIHQNKNFDICSTVRNMKSMLERMLEESILFVIDTPDTPCAIFADETRFEQCIMNLVINAKEAINNQGVISVIVKPVEFNQSLVVRFNELPAGKYYQVIVRDNGIGISSSVIENMFEPFYTTKSDGSGLGLSIVLDVIDQSQGGIDISSEEGLGTEFILYFPAVEFEINKQEGAAPKELEKLSNKFILLIDDERLIIKALEKILTGKGHRVLATTDIGEAKEMWNTHYQEIDLVISDIIMPEINGVELIQIFKHKRDEFPVLFISGYPGDYLRNRGIVFNDETVFLAKPFTKDDLLTTIATIFT
ncbi:MAG: response regulator [Candidatus Heimdallarchaeota archaeon]|nr:response regulator [Candidatus Heimdallarchaeota archaeon]